MTYLSSPKELSFSNVYKAKDHFLPNTTRQNFLESDITCKYLRMPFGILSARKKFQWWLTEGLTRLNGVTVVAEECLSLAHHDSNTIRTSWALLERAHQVELEINKEKGKFLPYELPYVGHFLTLDGVKPNSDKIQSIVNLDHSPQRERKVNGSWVTLPTCLSL